MYIQLAKKNYQKRLFLQTYYIQIRNTLTPRQRTLYTMQTVHSLEVLEQMLTLKRYKQYSIDTEQK